MVSEVEESLKRILKNGVREEALDEIMREIIKWFFIGVKLAMMMSVEGKVDLREAKPADDRFRKLWM